jgi:hypothetical protein
LKGTNENGKEGKELKKALEELKELKRLKEMHNSTRTKQEENVESQNTSDEQTNESELTDSDVEQERTSPKERIEDTGEKIGGARKDIIRKYADKINEILLDVTEDETWGNQEMMARTPAWNADLEIAHKAFYAAIAYDAIYQELSQSERRKIAHGLKRLAMDPLLGDWILEAIV